MHKDLSCKHVGEASWVLLQNLLIVFAWKFIDKNFQPSNRIIFQNISSTTCMLYSPVILKDLSFIELQTTFVVSEIYTLSNSDSTNPLFVRENLMFHINQQEQNLHFTLSLPPYLPNYIWYCPSVFIIFYIAFHKSLLQDVMCLIYNTWTVTMAWALLFLTFQSLTWDKLTLQCDLAFQTWAVPLHSASNNIRT